MTPLQIDWFLQLKKYRAIAVIRASDWQMGLKMAEIAIAGGLNLIEITWSSAEAGRLISYLREQYPDCKIGTGTILRSSELKEAIASGAEFAFSPHSDPQFVQIAHNADIPMVLGAMTPTEIVNAWQYGSDGVKVFPIKSVGGAQFVKCLQGPLRQIPLIPTGGVTLTNYRQFIEAGAIAVGLSSDLFPIELQDTHNWSELITRIQKSYLA
ncbi:2-keto-3-deoxy-phosphogluconate aldolase [[Leptolyngbya] sp. PCC 7376]|uniref:bifunctional 4-hydroxy-2-oxoglutarate aldolase/2-dehydro-3-deoxy-phosphogluconate aldolase n=1 Tax=[Leptolyngbya] sp. PCC 7376 TaxID=111781 RepID=UPI00029F0213|nr:bifunctional 4-hydroxy-2-oxoglutarate aldolase/2-dehydro-3-deoxy-phosphogluconate aldolase [[Leptolyngbya] sp. PCC 7376]AFY37784.1 2-keto-3-deoxy-phosphogluconate aldolase [[Leptolyngbya] sp. PCC 7376]